MPRYTNIADNVSACAIIIGCLNAKWEDMVKIYEYYKYIFTCGKVKMLTTMVNTVGNW
jgi:hypothetical protein